MRLCSVIFFRLDNMMVCCCSCFFFKFVGKEKSINFFFATGILIFQVFVISKAVIIFFFAKQTGEKNKFELLSCEKNVSHFALFLKKVT